MFNLNENSQFFISNAPSDMRVGVNAMCGKVRQAGGDPTDGKVYVFVGKTRKVMKLLHWERGGYVMYYKRLETGRLSPRLFPSDLHIGFREIRWDELVLFIEDVRASDYLQIDEVPWRIADRKEKSRHGYAWQFRDARPDSHGLYFYYLKGSRGGEIPRAQLKNYHGAIQTDGYKVYDYFERQENVTLLGCMAHIRRKFAEAERACPGVSSKALEYFGLLYTQEENLRQRKASYEEVAKERKEKGLPIMDTMEAWMKVASKTTTPSDLLGKALDYAYKLWPRMRNYALDGRYHLDNNDVERGQRPSGMGRKNYLFSHDDKGAEDNAIFYSLLESCDVMQLNPLGWLTDVLGRLRGQYG